MPTAWISNPTAPKRCDSANFAHSRAQTSHPKKPNDPRKPNKSLPLIKNWLRSAKIRTTRPSCPSASRVPKSQDLSLRKEFVFSKRFFPRIVHSRAQTSHPKSPSANVNQTNHYHLSKIGFVPQETGQASTALSRSLAMTKNRWICHAASHTPDAGGRRKTPDVLCVLRGSLRLRVEIQAPHRRTHLAHPQSPRGTQRTIIPAYLRPRNKNTPKTPNLSPKRAINFHRTVAVQLPPGLTNGQPTCASCTNLHKPAQSLRQSETPTPTNQYHLSKIGFESQKLASLLRNPHLTQQPRILERLVLQPVIAPRCPAVPAGSIFIFSSSGFSSVFTVRIRATYFAGSQYITWLSLKLLVTSIAG